MSKKFTLVLLSVLFVFPTLVWCYNWPIKPFAGPHSIYGTLGEYRTGHLHAGVDIGCTTGTEIFPVDSGLAFRVGEGYNAGVKVGNKDYIHLVEGTRIDDDPDGDGIPEGASVIAFQTGIGFTAITHLHFEENDGAVNPLRSSGLSNFSDTASPTINWIKVVKQGTGEDFPTTPDGISIVSGQVDIKSNAKDSMSNGSDTVAPYRIGYEIKNETGQTVVPQTFKIVFNAISGYSLSLIYCMEFQR